MPRLVVINADDFGLAPGVNRGILEAHAAGTLSSTSMMVNTPAFIEAAALARERAPRLGIGLHFNVLVGMPLTPASSLVDQRTGQFFNLAQLTRRAMTGKVTPADVRAECDAQLVALRAQGIVPTHLDSHRHAHALPGLLAPVLASALGAGVPIVRRPLDRPIRSEPMTSAKMLVLHSSWRWAAHGLEAAERALVARSPSFRGIALQGRRDVERRLWTMLGALPGGATEIMLHPGYDDATLAAQDPYRSEREREVRALTSALIRERLARGDVQLVSFAELARRA